MRDKIKEFKSNFVLLTVWKGTPDFITISQFNLIGNKWIRKPFLRQRDMADVQVVLTQYEEWKKEEEPANNNIKAL